MGAETSDSSAADRPAISLLRRIGWPCGLAVAGGVVFVVSWAVFVAEGSQLAYVVALASAAAAAALLAWRRSWLAVLLIVALATLVGTEARGELGRGATALGSLRLLDAALLAAGAGLLVRHVLDRGLREATAALLSRWKSISVETWIVIATVVWAAVLWIAHGAHGNAHVRTDMRLILLAGGTYAVARALVPPRWSLFTLGLLALAVLVALKSASIYVTAPFEVATLERLQTAFVGVPTRRVLVIGGDTLLILAPALATGIALRAQSRSIRAWCAIAGVCAMGGVLLSGSRTNLLVAVAIFLGTLFLFMRARGLRLTRLSALAGVLIVLATASGVYVTGVGERLTTRDEPHVGLNFRRDEIASVTTLPDRDLLLGQGLGGSFVSRDSSGATVQTGWSHVLPVWIVLKVGLLGLVALLWALGLLFRRVLRAVRSQVYGAPFIGAQLIVGLIVMSLTINRVAQPEGAILMALGAVLIQSSTELGPAAAAWRRRSNPSRPVRPQAASGTPRSAGRAAPAVVAIFSASGLGGSELFNLEFLRRAHALGCRIEALVPEDGPLIEALDPLVERVQVVPIPLEITSLSRFDTRLGVGAARALTGLARYRQRLNAAVENTDGALACLGFRSQLACAVTAAARRRRRCWVVHEVVPSGPFGLLWGASARGAELVVTYSEAAARQPMLRLARPLVLDVRFELGAFSALPDPAAPPRRLGLVGDLFPLKNHLGLIEVVRRLLDQGEDVEGVLVARETADARYVEAVHRALDDAHGRVHLRAVTPREMPAAMKQIDCLLQLSSVPESFGRVCVEAMAAGRPVIAFGHGGVAELVEDGATGILCPPGELGAVSTAVTRLRREDGLFERLSATARQRAAQRWSSDRPGTTIGDALAAFAAGSADGPDREQHLHREQPRPGS